MDRFIPPASKILDERKRLCDIEGKERRESKENEAYAANEFETALAEAVGKCAPLLVTRLSVVLGHDFIERKYGKPGREIPGIDIEARPLQEFTIELSKRGYHLECIDNVDLVLSLIF
jgi:hypothetical protein